ncbi:hypothetical protein BaRGS_00009233 [Batillaria attramentaria]|uniref:Uncharacterized protein n=1 Tax=Batillaria attramentaria TaxID=370345 RepID=A0ABD0LJW3_9CAEN
MPHTPNCLTGRTSRSSSSAESTFWAEVSGSSNLHDRVVQHSLSGHAARYGMPHWRRSVFVELSIHPPPLPRTTTVPANQRSVPA